METNFKRRIKKTEDDFKKSLEGKRIPILPLDGKWHELFGDELKSKQMLKLEKEVDELMKRQGFLTQEIKDLKKVKSNLLNDIVDNISLVSENENSDVPKVMTQDQKLIKEVNEKLEAYEDELLDLPYLLKETNNKLMILSMDVCYNKMFDNSDLIEELNDWIKKVRIELKKNIILKQDSELQNHRLYSYMHDIFGAEVIDIFDMKYLGDYINKKNE